MIFIIVITLVIGLALLSHYFVKSFLDNEKLVKEYIRRNYLLSLMTVDEKYVDINKSLESLLKDFTKYYLPKVNNTTTNDDLASLHLLQFLTDGKAFEDIHLSYLDKENIKEAFKSLVMKHQYNFKVYIMLTGEHYVMTLARQATIELKLNQNILQYVDVDIIQRER